MDDVTAAVERSAGPIVTILVIAIVAYAAWRLLGPVVERRIERRLAAGGEAGSPPDASGLEAQKRLRTVMSLVDWVLRVTIISAAVLALLIALDLSPVIVAIVVVIALVAVVARDVLRDYVAGVLIVLENHYSIGDWVRVAGEYGEVEALGLRRTLLRTGSGDLVMVPNGDIRSVTNRTRIWGRIEVRIAITDPGQLEAARGAIDEAGRDLARDPEAGPSVLEAPRFVMVEGIDAEGIRLLIWGRVRAADRFRAEGEYRRLLLGRLGEAGVEVVTSHRVHVVTEHPAPDWVPDADQGGSGHERTVIR